MKISDIYTKANSDKGATIKVPFVKGKKKPTLTIYGCDGQRFQEAANQSQIEIAKAVAEPAADAAKAKLEIDYRFAARMVKAWSFDEECTVENAVALFKSSPGVFELVNRAVFDRALFLE